MAMGTVQTILVCVPSDATESPCPSGMSLATTQAYLIDPAQAASIEAQNAAFDYATASAIWGFAFTFVLSLYLVSKAAGTVLNRIRK
jgi:hypothetical protein